MKKTTLLLAMVLTVSPSAPTLASGFPTVDLAALAQRIIQMQQVLNQYSEMIKQTGLNVDQLNQMYEQYKQALITYDHLLEQAQALEHQVARKDWLKFMEDISQIEMVNPWNTGAADIRESSDAHVRAGVEQSNNMYGSISKKDEYQAMLKKAFGSTYVSPEELQSYNQANMAATQRGYVDFTAKKSAEVAQTISKLDEDRLKLGDNSQLATSQFIAEQNQVLMAQLQINNELLRQQMDTSNQFENYFFIKKQQDKERRLQDAIESVNTPIVIDESSQFRP